MKFDSTRTAYRLLQAASLLALLALFMGYKYGRSLALRDNSAELQQAAQTDDPESNSQPTAR